MNNQEIVAKLWNLCNVLRDDGITYHQYVTELTYILFLKMARETGAEEKFSAGVNLAEGDEKEFADKQVIFDYSWDELTEKSGAGQYFTPRVLIDVMTRLMKPRPGECCNDKIVADLIQIKKIINTLKTYGLRISRCFCVMEEWF